MRAIIACLVIFIIGYHVGNKQHKNSSDAKVFHEISSAEDSVLEISSNNFVYLKSDSVLTVKIVDFNYVE